MNFPQTSKTLIFRVAAEGKEQDWHQFLSDYWLPVCRFAQRRSGLRIEDAEDVASETFEAILGNNLLQRWASQPSSKLRTLLCTVVRHILGNRARIQKGRRELLSKNAVELLGRTDLPTLKAMDEPAESIDEFYTVWVQEFLTKTVESLMQEYHQTGKGDYFRVLHGRICEQMTMLQVADSLGIKKTDAENYYKAARKRLTAKLHEFLNEHVRRYCPSHDAEDEFQNEWNKMAQYLEKHGGLERAIVGVHKNAAPKQTQTMTALLNRLTRMHPTMPDQSDDLS
jgi:RNA polymerase sigma factor (sigma-70 family)